MNNNESFFEGSHLVVSQELLHFLRWIILTEPEALQILIQQACEAGIIDQAIAYSAVNPSLNDELRQGVIDFFDLLEIKIQEAHLDHENPVHNLALRPAVSNIDSSLCDHNTVSLSLAQASSQQQVTTVQHAREALYKELLKNWKPRNKKLLH